jgi:hypothetical protein
MAAPGTTKSFIKNSPGSQRRIAGSPPEEFSFIGEDHKGDVRTGPVFRSIGKRSLSARRGGYKTCER